MREYLPILIFLGIAVAIGRADGGGLLRGRPARRPDPEKLSPYECGFDAFDDARRKFDVRFYLVVHALHHLRSRGRVPVSVGDFLGRRSALFGFWSMMIFLGVLTVGFIYEWKKGALEWE